MRATEQATPLHHRSPTLRVSNRPIRFYVQRVGVTLLSEHQQLIFYNSLMEESYHTERRREHGRSQREYPFQRSWDLSIRGQIFIKDEISYNAGSITRVLALCVDALQRYNASSNEKFRRGLQNW